MNKPVIAIDFDDVIAGFNQAYVPYHNRYYQPQMTFADMVEYDLTDFYNIDYDTFVERVWRFYTEHHDTILPIAGAKEALDQLTTNAELHIVTSRCESLRKLTTDWLNRYDLHRFADMHFTNSFGSKCTPKRNKLEVCESIGASALIEDAPHNAESVAAGGVPVLLFDRPWNTKTQHNQITRVHTWEDVMKELG